MSESGLVSDTLQAIEGELRALWAVPDEATQLPKVRASTLNLAIMAAGSVIERYASSTDELSETHAGRVLLVSLDGRLPGWAIEHEVSGVCRPSASGAEPICNDRVELRCGALVGPRVRSLLRALALPEIPLVAEVGEGAPTGLVDPVVQSADRVIVDSAHTAYRRIWEIALLSEAAIVDRAFIRQHGWREMTARLFDDAVDALDAIERLSITSAPLGRAPDPGLLIAGWLASRLGWQVGDDGAVTDRGGKRVEIAVSVGPTPGEISGIAIDTKLGGAPVSLSCTRAPGTRTLQTRRRGARESEHEHAMGHRDETWVLRKAIDTSHAVAAVYRQALAAAARLEGARGAA